MAYRDVVLADSPIEYWELNETSGTSAASSGSGAHAATHSGGVTLGNPGVASKDATYDGSTGLTTVPTTVTDFMSGSAYSVECWVKYDGTGTQDYPTFFRRDGNSKTLLVRSRGNAVGSINTIEAYVSGQTVSTGATTFNDNKWHHVVVTVSGTTVRLFIDAVEYTTKNGTTTTGGTGATAAYIGRGAGAGEYFKGGMDEVAIYTTALSPTRITAHYNAGVPVSVSYTAAAMSATTSSMPAAVTVAQRNISLAATVVTANATMPDAVQRSSTNLAPADDYYYDAQTGSINQISVLNIADVIGGGTAAGRAVMKFNTPDGATYVSNVLHMYVNGFAASSWVYYPILSAFAGEPNSKSSFNLGTAQTFTVSATGAMTIDLGYLGNQKIYGLYFEPTTSTGTGNYLNIAATEDSNSAHRPYLALNYYYQVTNASVAATAMTVDTSVMQPAVVSIWKDATHAASVATGSATSPDVIVVAQHDAAINASVLTADSSMSGGLFTNVINVGGGPMAGNANIVAAATSTTLGVNVAGIVMTGTAKWVVPSVNGSVIGDNPDEDPFYVRTHNLAPSYWWRFQDAGSTVKDEVSGQTTGTPSGTYHGVMGNQHIGPDGRSAATFPAGGAGYITQNEGQEVLAISDPNRIMTTLGFGIRTTKQNTTVMSGQDATQYIATTSDANPTELYIKNGKLTYRVYQYGSYKEFTSFKNIADGEWHYISIRSGVQSRITGEIGNEIWIDGKMDIRRYFYQSWIGMPDSIGSSVPPNSFEGDIAELTFFTRDLGEDDMIRSYYDFMAYAPAYASAMTADVAVPSATGKGNQKRALLLYFEDHRISKFDPTEGEFINDIYDAPLTPRTSEVSGDFMGYKVFTKSTHVDYGDPTKTNQVDSYRDPVTDEISLVDLTSDVNLDEYDMIMVREWPDDDTAAEGMGQTREWYETEYPGQLERLKNQLLDANRNGKKLMITHPRLALDMGIVNTYSFVPPMRESAINAAQGNALGYYDYGSAEVFPWNITASDGMTNAFASGTGEVENLTDTFLSNKAYYYYDTHANNRFRVRALVEGLTDIPSYMIEESIWHVDADIWGWQGLAMKYLNRMNGLQIGDEFIFAGSPLYDPTFDSDAGPDPRNRYNGTWAAPVSAVNVGTVVTTFGASMWQGKTVATNSYKDYATTIVLETGTILGGQSTGARIFCNFTEEPMGVQGLAKQILPTQGNGQWPRSYGGLGNGVTGDIAQVGSGETSAQMQWDYSWTRTTLTTEGQETTQSANIALPDGTIVQVTLGHAGKNDNMSMVRSHQLFPIVVLPCWTMVARGFNWLGSEPELNPGDVVVRAGAMSANAVETDATVVAEHANTVSVGAMRATATITEAAEAKSGDVNVVATAMTVEALFTSGLNRGYFAAPMTAEATFVEAFDAIHSTGEPIILTLYEPDYITLYIKEDV